VTRFVRGEWLRLVAAELLVLQAVLVGLAQWLWAGLVRWLLGQLTFVSVLLLLHPLALLSLRLLTVVLSVCVLWLPPLLLPPAVQTLLFVGRGPLGEPHGLLWPDWARKLRLGLLRQRPALPRGCQRLPPCWGGPRCQAS
jgi:hypothetical protein